MNHWSPALAWGILTAVVVVFVVVFDVHAHNTGGVSMSAQFRSWLLNPITGPFIFGGWIGIFTGLMFHWFQYKGR